MTPTPSACKTVAAGFHRWHGSLLDPAKSLEEKGAHVSPPPLICRSCLTGPPQSRWAAHMCSQPSLTLCERKFLQLSSLLVKVSQGLFLLKPYSRNLVSFPFLSSRGCLHSLELVPSSIFKVHHFSLCFPHHMVSPTLTLPVSLLYKSLCFIYSPPRKFMIISSSQDFLLSHSCKVLFSIQGNIHILS